MVKKPRQFISRARCIYLGEDLDDMSCTTDLRPTKEHIIPLSLGGSNHFFVFDVSQRANTRAGNEIDNAVASSLPFLMIRQRYGLAGHRKIIPTVVLAGQFENIRERAELSIDSTGCLSWKFIDKPEMHGDLVTISGGEEKMRLLLQARLRQAKTHNKTLSTKFGQIVDEEDIEAALLLSDSKQGKEFHANVMINVKDYHYAFVRLLTKIALCAGHLVLGAEWTFSPEGIFLRNAIFAKPADQTMPEIHGSLTYDFDQRMVELLGIQEGRHVVAVLPCGKKVVAIVSLFGNEVGTAVIEISSRMTRKFFDANHIARQINCVFHIDLDKVNHKHSFKSLNFAQLGERANYLQI